MKLAINLTLSFVMLALCLWLVWPGASEQHQLKLAFTTLHWSTAAPYFFGFLGLQVVVHLCRSLRWNNLLAPLGVKLATGPLLAISSVGFMAILALPARLGEFVRPGLLRKYNVSASAALGTVAVERIVDGLLISLFLFVAFFMRRGPDAPDWMMRLAYVVISVFGAALGFLVFAMWRPQQTVRFCLRMSLIERFFPRIARVIEAKLLDLIRGFSVLKDPVNLVTFVIWSLVYWVCNGIGVWLICRMFGLPISVIGGMATMALVAVGISLPNSPGLVGQFQGFTLLGLSIYLGGGITHPETVAAGAHLHAAALASAIAQHLLQVIWYVAMGFLGVATPWVSFADIRRARRSAPTVQPPFEPETGANSTSA
ncbi:lysylphosphatidylglycerol synthase transmembrane domain-containing protein [soil metagenome]